LDSAEIKYLKINFNEVLKELRDYALVKGRSHKTKAILLTGSLATGTYTGTSDADLLIIADDVPPRSLDRYGIFADDSLSLDVEPRVFTTKEFLKMVRERDRLAIESVVRGIPLFGGAFILNLKSEYGISS
jgi:predicted nucleotidyltransferase